MYDEISCIVYIWSCVCTVYMRSKYVDSESLGLICL